MNENNHKNFMRMCLLDLTVVGFACITALKNILFLIICIAIPSIFFGVDQTILFKITMLIITIVLISSVYIVLCFLKQWWILRNDEEKSKFLNLSSKERGIKIGDNLY